VPLAGSVAVSENAQAAWSSDFTHSPQVQCCPDGHELSAAEQR
jgi:hypothetical protein